MNSVDAIIDAVRQAITKLPLGERYELREAIKNLLTECEPVAPESTKRTAAEVFPPPPFSEHDISLPPQ